MKRQLIFVFLFATTLCLGQENKSDTLRIYIQQPSIFISVGVLPTYIDAMGSFELMVVKRPDKFLKTRGMRFGFGTYSFWGESGVNATMAYSALSGMQNNHLEFGMGLTILINHNSDIYMLPAANLGYRFQEPDGKFIFRTGLGFPEGLYLGLGVRLK